MDGGGAAALDVAESCEAGFHADGVVDEAGDVFGHFGAFCDDGDDVTPAVGDFVLDAGADAIEVVIDFRDEADFRAGGEGGGGSEVAAVAAHDLDDEGAREGGGGIAYGVDGLADDVEGGVYAEAVIGAGDVVIDGGGDAGEGHFKVGVELVERAE